MKNIIFVIMAMMVLGVSLASAATPAAITGTIYGSDGTTPVEGASVVATCNAVSEPAVLSDADGTYYVIFDAATCGYDMPVSVTATKGDATGTNNGETCDVASDCEIPVALVDVTIPEFGVIAGGIALLAGIGIIAYRRK